MNQKRKFNGRLRGLCAFLCAVAVLLTKIPFGAAANETPSRVFEGRVASSAVLANLDYTDVKNSDTWAKEAIWETGALELMKGYGNKQFGLNRRLTVEQAIAIAYNMAGREAEAQLAAEALDQARREGNKKILAPRMWSDGYLQLALNDGIITQADYNDAFVEDQLSLEAADFLRNSSVTREDMAYYVARVLAINPIRGQTHLFNDYRDWQDANPHRIPYIEALLQNRVMNGNDNGAFSPKGYVTRAQAAQIIQNAEPFIFSKLNMEKMKGTIEEIFEYIDKTKGKSTLVTNVNVRNTDGTLNQIRFSYPAGTTGSNEMTGNKKSAEAKGTIVNEGRTLKNETVLKEGQEISYIIQNGSVLYASIVADPKKTEYYLGKILSVDEANQAIRSEILMRVPFSDPRLMDLKSLYSMGSTGTDELLSVSKGALIFIDFVQKTLKEVEPESLMLITLENGLVTGLEKLDMDLLLEEGIVSGILEENNPALGYVTLYFPDGSGTSPDFSGNLSHYRTYSYLNAGDVAVYKNGSSAAIEALQAGDSVFIKLDDDGNIIRISGTDNFYPVYGRVRTKSDSLRSLQLEKENGTFEQIQIPTNTPIFQDKKRITWNEIEEGDKLRILLQTSANQVLIGEVTLEKDSRETTGIYKAEMGYYDEFAQKVVVSGLQQFKDGIWKAASPRGITQLMLHEDYSPDISKGAQGTVYIATGENLMGDEAVIYLAVDAGSIRNGILNDTIVEAQPGRGSLSLLNGDTSIRYDSSSLIVKDGSLLRPNQVKSLDEAYLATSSYADGSQKANIIWIREPIEDTGLMLIRGRISRIEAQSTMTLESFSQFRSPSWEFMNVQKTLTLDPLVTRILDDAGRMDLAKFDDTGETNFKNRTVYALVQDGKAMLISTAPYGDVVYTGRISKMNGAVTDSFGQLVELPDSFLMQESRSFNPQTWMWDAKADTRIALAPNTVLTKNGKIIDAGQLDEGDRVTVIRSVTGENADVIIAESN